MADILNELLFLQNQVRIYHWQTTSYARHKAFEFLYESLNELIDKFIETYQGIYGRIKLVKGKSSIRLENSDGKEIETITNCRDMFDKLVTKQIKKTDLLNIRDEILGTINKTLYLLSLGP